MQLYDLRYLAFINLTFATNETLNTRMIKNIIAKYLDENNLGNYYLERYTQDNVAIHERDIHLEEDYANIDNLFPPIIYVYVATNSDGDIRDCSEVCSLQPDATLSEVKAKASLEINICPVCGKSVPFTNQSGFSFAGRCCKDCLPEMKKKYEYPGWYN